MPDTSATDRNSCTCRVGCLSRIKEGSNVQSVSTAFDPVYLVLIVAVMIAMGIILNMVIKRGSFDPGMDRFLSYTALAVVAVGIVAILINIWIAAQISKPIEIITEGWTSMARGNLRHRITFCLQTSCIIWGSP